MKSLYAGFIGKKHLNAAIEEVLSNPSASAPRPIAFSVMRVPFFLEPEYDETAPFVESNRERLVKKWGGVQGWNAQKNRHDLKGRGLEAGIPHFNLDRLAANSMASHRLIQMIGKTYGLRISETVYDVLNHYYFVDGHSLNDRPQLAQTVADTLAKTVGDDVSALTPEELLKFLESDQGRTEIELALGMLTQLGVHGIPKFIIEGATVIDGAAHADMFVEVFREIEKRGSLKGKPVFAELLGISPDVVSKGSHWAADLAA